MILVVNMIAEDWVESKDAREKDMMITWARRARVVIIIGYSVMSMVLAFVVLLPALGTSITYDASMSVDTSRLLPLQAYHIYNLTVGPLYKLTYISHVVFLFFCIVTYTGIDNFLGLLVFHICGQLEILRARLVRLNKLMKFRNGLRSCVLRHERLLRCAMFRMWKIFHTRPLLLFLSIRKRIRRHDNSDACVDFVRKGERFSKRYGTNVFCILRRVYVDTIVDRTT